MVRNQNRAMRWAILIILQILLVGCASGGVIECPPKCSGENLSSRDLSQMDYSHAALNKARLSRSTLVRTNLSYANLSGADLSEANLNQANLRGASLIGANLKNARLVGVDLTDADLQGADLTGAVLSRVVLKSTKLTATILNKTRLIGTFLSGARLAGNPMIGADLRGADLSGADLSGANLSEARLDAADLTRANLSGARLVDAIMPGAKMGEAQLSGADLQGAGAFGADMHSANLSGANLRDVDMGGVNLEGANLSRATLINATLSGAVLTGADFRNAIMSGVVKVGKEDRFLVARLDGAVLNNTNWAGAYVVGAHFTGSDMRGTDMGNATLRDTVQLNGQPVYQAVSLTATTFDQKSTFPAGFDPSNPGATLTPTPTNTPTPTRTFTPTPTRTPTPSPTPGTSLAAYWKFDEGTGIYAYDAWTTGNTGTLVNPPTWENTSLAPVVGNRYALQFDGLNRSVSISDTQTLRPTSLTLAGWFLWQSVPTSSQSLIAKLVGTATYDSYQLFYDVGTHQIRGVLGGPNAFGVVVSYGWTPVENVWYHLALSFDNSTKATVLYLNGVPVAAQIAPSDFAIGYDNRSLEIGRDNDDGMWTAFFKGQVDEVGLYYRALSAMDIAALGAVTRPLGLQVEPSATPTLAPTRNATPTLTPTFSLTGVAPSAQSATQTPTLTK